MLLINIVREITAVRVRYLIKRRDNAIRNEDYHKAWVLDTAINKNANLVFSLS